MKNIFNNPSPYFFILLIFLFVLISFLVQENLYLFEQMKINRGEGMFLYVCITIIATVIAPISSLPLIVIASNLWGWVVAGILSIVGWFIGAAIAFELARVYGKKLIQRIINLKLIEATSTKLPQKYTLLILILLRMFIPVDILSYVLGLFSTIDQKTYYIGTAIGIVPFAFVFSYFGTVSYHYQIIIMGITIFAIGTYWSIIRFWPSNK